MTDTTKRQITPHKGGRSKQFNLRIKPEVLRKAKRIAKAQGVTVADLIEQFIENYNLPERNEK